MRAEVFHPDTPDDVLAVATWGEGRAQLEILHDTMDGLDGLLRQTPIVVPGGFPKRLGTRGDTVEHPGSPAWFREALRIRSEALGLKVRFVAPDLRNGWDPAANVRTFEDQDWRLGSEP